MYKPRPDEIDLPPTRSIYIDLTPTWSSVAPHVGDQYLADVVSSEVPTA